MQADLFAQIKTKKEKNERGGLKEEKRDDSTPPKKHYLFKDLSSHRLNPSKLLGETVDRHRWWQTSGLLHP